jgi:hypothetical protein
VEPSGLVLVAILGVWAAYLVPHWVRRREELAQSRTPDRFSAGLRVLQRRRRKDRSGHRSGGAVLTSPRVVVDTDGELLYVPGARPAAAEAPSAPAVAARADSDAVLPPSAGSASRPMVRTPVAKRAAPALPEPIEAAEPVVAADPVAGAPVGVAPVGVAPRPRGARNPRDLAVALESARRAAKRRATIMLVLLAVTVTAFVARAALGAPVWVVLPSLTLLVSHLLASRVAAIRSGEHLAVLREQIRRGPVAQPRPARTARPAAASAARPAVATPAASVPGRVARRAVAVGAETWDPIPVPAPTYTLKPAVFRPEPPPLDLPAVAAAAPAPSRGALPRRAEDIERILALDPEPELGFQHRTAVNG